jgi:hypothetical protein
MQPRPAASVMPPLSIVKVAGESPPPILFWPSEGCPIFPACPPDAVSSNEHEDLGTTRAEAPRANESVTNVYIKANV